MPKEDSNTIKEDILAHYNFVLTDAELADVNAIIKNIDSKIVSKKDATTIKSRYTLLASKNNYYLLGDGEREGQKNAFIASGSFGRVKAAVKLIKDESQRFILSHEIYLVKIFKKNRHDNYFFAGKQKEAQFIARVYGFSETILRDDGKRLYLIMPLIPGVDLMRINYQEIEKEEIKNILIDSCLELIKIHAKGIYHNDIKHDNILYDKVSRKVFFVDFGNSTEIVDPKVLPEKELNNLYETLCTILHRYAQENIVGFRFQTLRPSINKLLKPIKFIIDEAFRKSFKDLNVDTFKHMLTQQLEEIIGLLNNNLDINELKKLNEEQLFNLLYQAVILNDLITFKEVLRFFPPASLDRYYDKEGLYLLHKAFELKRLEMAEAIIEAGANVNLAVVNDSELTILHALTYFGEFDDYNIVRLLLLKGASIDIPDSEGNTVRTLLEKNQCNVKLKNILLKEPVSNSLPKPKHSL